MERNDNVLSYGDDGMYGFCDICSDKIEGVGLVSVLLSSLSILMNSFQIFVSKLSLL